MKREEIIALICEPSRISTIDQIKNLKSQLRNLENMIRIDEIVSYIGRNLDLIENWASYSNQKSGRTGYYLKMDRKIKEFGFYDSESNKRNSIIKSTDYPLIVAFFIIFDLKLHNLIFYL